jgi:hypothetical protein
MPELQATLKLNVKVANIESAVNKLGTRMQDRYQRFGVSGTHDAQIANPSTLIGTKGAPVSLMGLTNATLTQFNLEKERFEAALNQELIVTARGAAQKMAELRRQLANLSKMQERFYAPGVNLPYDIKAGGQLKRLIGSRTPVTDPNIAKTRLAQLNSLRSFAPSNQFEANELGIADIARWKLKFAEYETQLKQLVTQANKAEQEAIRERKAGIKLAEREAASIASEQAKLEKTVAGLSPLNRLQYNAFGKMPTQKYKLFGRGNDSLFNQANHRITNVAQLMGTSLYGLGALGGVAAISRGAVDEVAQADRTKLALAGMVNEYYKFLDAQGKSVSNAENLTRSIAHATTLYAKLRESAVMTLMKPEQFADIFTRNAGAFRARGFSEAQTLDMITKVVAIGRNQDYGSAGLEGNLNALARGIINPRGARVLGNMGYSQADFTPAVKADPNAQYALFKKREIPYEGVIKAQMDSPVGKMNEFSVAMENLQLVLGEKVLPYAIPIINQLTASINDWVSSGNAGKFGKSLGEMLERIGKTFAWFVNTGSHWIKSIEDVLIVGFGAAMTKFVAGIVAEKVMASSALSGFIGVLGGFVAGIIFLYKKARVADIAQDDLAMALTNADEGKGEGGTAPISSIQELMGGITTHGAQLQATKDARGSNALIVQGARGIAATFQSMGIPMTDEEAMRRYSGAAHLVASQHDPDSTGFKKLMDEGLAGFGALTGEVQDPEKDPRLQIYNRFGFTGTTYKTNPKFNADKARMLREGLSNMAQGILELRYNGQDVMLAKVAADGGNYTQDQRRQARILYEKDPDSRSKDTRKQHAALQKALRQVGYPGVEEDYTDQNQVTPAALKGKKGGGLSSMGMERDTTEQERVLHYATMENIRASSAYEDFEVGGSKDIAYKQHLLRNEYNKERRKMSAEYALELAKDSKITKHYGPKGKAMSEDEFDLAVTQKTLDKLHNIDVKELNKKDAAAYKLDEASLQKQLEISRKLIELSKQGVDLAAQEANIRLGYLNAGLKGAMSIAQARGATPTMLLGYQRAINANDVTEKRNLYNAELNHPKPNASKISAAKDALDAAIAQAGVSDTLDLMNSDKYDRGEKDYLSESAFALTFTGQGTPAQQRQLALVKAGNAASMRGATWDSFMQYGYDVAGINKQFSDQAAQKKRTENAINLQYLGARSQVFGSDRTELDAKWRVTQAEERVKKVESGEDTGTSQTEAQSLLNAANANYASVTRAGTYANYKAQKTLQGATATMMNSKAGSAMDALNGSLEEKKAKYESMDDSVLREKLLARGKLGDGQTPSHSDMVTMLATSDVQGVPPGDVLKAQLIDTYSQALGEGKKTGLNSLLNAGGNVLGERTLNPLMSQINQINPRYGAGSSNLINAAGMMIGGDFGGQSKLGSSVGGFIGGLPAVMGALGPALGPFGIALGALGGGLIGSLFKSHYDPAAEAYKRKIEDLLTHIDKSLRPVGDYYRTKVNTFNKMSAYIGGRAIGVGDTLGAI